MTDHNDESDMHGWSGKYPSRPLNKPLRQRARELRADQTPAERRLWRLLSGKQRLGFKFRRQHVIDRFIVDFYCADAALVIELDGKVHRYTREHDAERQNCLEELGLTVLRFTNEDVHQRLEGVVTQIDEALASHRHNTSPSSPR